jgi:glyoxylase-like metal-dependent hydrolase (beta-lactamase superfamily II)
MKVIPLSEGAFTIDKTKLFVPFDETKDELQDRPVGSLLVEIQPFAIITSKEIILCDTGLGFADDNGTMQLLTNLSREGINPSQVTKVLLSHLHKDHSGGLGLPTNKSKLALPNAVYYIQEREYQFAIEKSFPSYIVEDLEALKSDQRIKFLSMDSGYIDESIQYLVTGGHCPFHQVFWIRENNETIFFGGDVAPQLQQMRIRYKTKYDFDPQRAMDLRKQWWEEGKKEHWKFLFYHDIKSPIFSQ